ncbi:DUF3488 and transglutaminase-like domain-containing protein [Demequina sp. NBRC 110057]|uniref:transglutaminase family protein n=1 Tax=Demequina sp. NBRC 110057 TaxID=1570346 RepID=UPI001178A485|nr:DUF3488 and transglutaminase-like domain-containing protein [Demequina sp. NBRC 110057]
MSARNRSASPWRTTPLVAVAAGAGVFALQPVVVMGTWLATVIGLLAVVTAAVVATRLLSRSRVLPTLLGLAVSIVAMVILFSRTDEGERHLLPTPRALVDLGHLLREGVDYAATTVAPADVTAPLQALICACLLLLFLAAEHIAVSWRGAASAGLVLMLPWLPAAVFQQRVPLVWLVVALGAWLLTLAASRRGDPASPPGTAGGAVAATAASLGLALLVVPSALGGNGWGVIPRIDAPSALDGTTRLNLDLDLRTSLTTNSTAPALVYTADGSRPEVFRLYALGAFDGVSWVRDEPDPDALTDTEGVLWPVGIDEASPTSATYTIDAVGLAETNLPLPAAPRTVDVDGDWGYDASLDEVVGDDESTLSATYTVTADTGYLTADRLLASPAEAGGEGDAGLSAAYLELPPAMDSARVSDLAHSLTEEATSRFAQAVMLQDYLRDPSEFDYDTSVSPTTGDTVSSFLDSRAGYCVQFATTMVMMARTLEIPARLAVGFLPGSAGDGDTFIVQGGDAHAWPELWFPEVGWVRFEPTPSVQTGSAPRYSSNGANVTPAVPDSQAQQPTIAPQQPERPDTGDAPATGGTTSTETGPSWWWAAVAVVVLGVAGAAVAMWRGRRGQVAAPLAAPEHAWESLREALPAEARWPRSLTPREAGEHVAAALAAQGVELNGPDREALTSLASAVESHRYSPTGCDVEPAHLDAWARQVADAATSVTARA